IAAAATVFIAARLWRPAPQLAPFVIYSLLMLVAMVRVNGEGPRYLTPYFPAMLIFASWTAGLLLARAGPRARALGYARSAAVCVLRFAVTRAQLAGYLVEQDPRPAAVLAAVRAQGLEARRLLAPQLDLPTLHYYFPRGTFRGYLDPADIPASLAAD